MVIDLYSDYWFDHWLHLFVIHGNDINDVTHIEILVDLVDG